MSRILWCFALCWLGPALLLPRAAAQVQFQIAHAFGAGDDGEALWSGVVVDADGNLFGTAAGGGAYGLGMVYELSPGEAGAWAESVPYSFGASGANDGRYPYGPVTLGSGGILYGGTPEGGAHGKGVAYSLTPGVTGWTETILRSFSFRDGVDGFSSNLALDAEGNLFGRGGTFELSPSAEGWVFTQTCTWLFVCAVAEEDGTALGPGDRLLAAGVDGKYRVGNVYAVVPTPNGWKAGDLYDFGGFPDDGQIPAFGPLVADSAGNIYGVTRQGGAYTCGNTGCGTIYKLTRQANGSWQEAILYNFRPPWTETGYNPTAGVILDKGGNLYGTTGYGGPCDCGVVYQLLHHQNDTWSYEALHTFTNTDGALPYSALTLDSHGNLFGTTVGGGPSGGGVVYELSPTNTGTN